MEEGSQWKNVVAFYPWEGQVCSVIYTGLESHSSQWYLAQWYAFSLSFSVLLSQHPRSYFLISSPKQITYTQIFDLISAFKEIPNWHHIIVYLCYSLSKRAWDFIRKGVNITPKWILWYIELYTFSFWGENHLFITDRKPHAIT